MNERILNPFFESGDRYIINLIVYDVRKKKLGVLRLILGEDLKVGRLGTNVIGNLRS